MGATFRERPLSCTNPKELASPSRSPGS